MRVLDEGQDENGEGEVAYNGADLGERLSVIVDLFGISAVSQKTQKSTKQIRRYCEGAEPPFKVLAEIVEMTGASYDWLATGKSRTYADHELSLDLLNRELDRSRGQSRTNLSRSEVADLKEEEGILCELIEAEKKWLSLASQKASPQTDTGKKNISYSPKLVQLPEFDIRASAGLGLPVGNEVQLGVLAFDRQFLRDHGARPEKCSVITASGDSMQPAIPDGSMLVVDHSQTEVKNGHIMVINIGDDLLVKRIRRRLDGTIELISDNQLYPPEIIGPAALDQLRVVGRVVYFCRTP